MKYPGLFFLYGLLFPDLFTDAKFLNFVLGLSPSVFDRDDLGLPLFLVVFLNFFLGLG
jgi:hypothetical protein